jgi:hypothetical protein
MNDMTKRFLLFLIGCIGVRSLFVVIAKRIDKEYLPYLGIPALLLSLGWMYLYFFNKRLTGQEVFGNKIWWHKLRIVHALFYLGFAISAFQKSEKAWIWLLADVIFGLVSFLIFHYGEGDFKKVFG